MVKAWYAVAVSSERHGSGTIESFEHLGNAKAFAVAMCENLDILLDRAIEEGIFYGDDKPDRGGHSAECIDSVFIDRWVSYVPHYDQDIDETFAALKYYPKGGANATRNG